MCMVLSVLTKIFQIYINHGKIMQSALAQDKNQGSVVQNYDQQQNNNQLMFNE